MKAAAAATMARFSVRTHLLRTHVERRHVVNRFRTIAEPLSQYCFPRHPEPEDYGVDTGLILTIGGRPETTLSDPKARRGGYCLLWVFSRQQKHRSALPRRPHPYILRYPDSLTPYKGCMSLSAWRALGFGAGRSIGGGASFDPLFTFHQRSAPMFWDFITIAAIFGAFFFVREAQTVLAKARLSNWRTFTFR
ncbi:hypothetical protein QA644_08765 [Rhizobium sp. CC1099]|uniref:hypothetical protein n=1 Tax=Rhizobium sp. CC1099 TaxID=3039160 RepID=UPI0024B0983C|nr:hypothetical protein [Rhizobium sp. CC1099]WFU89112.1 hypothetical protein QA644_08765 [Rhizobium sp. CC1099]